jgi:hypothetical protein
MDARFLRPFRSSAVCAAVLLALTGCSIAVGAPRAAPLPSSSSSSSTVVVPLDVVHEQSATLAIVPVKINGKGPYPFILDTGASTSGVNADLAAQLGLPRTGKSSTVAGVVSSSQVPLVRVDQWSVGGVTLRPTTIGALEFGTQNSSSSPTQSTSKIAGLLGSDQLSRFGSITLDYQRQQLRFTPVSAG